MKCRRRREFSMILVNPFNKKNKLAFLDRFSGIKNTRSFDLFFYYRKTLIHLILLSLIIIISLTLQLLIQINVHKMLIANCREESKIFVIWYNQNHNTQLLSFITLLVIWKLKQKLRFTLLKWVYYITLLVLCNKL